jgi:hypothetical protein
MDELQRYKKNLASQCSRLKNKERFAEAIRRGKQSVGHASDAVPGLLEVKTSTIPNSGKGVFATRFIREGELIIMPMGEIVYFAEQSDAAKVYSYEIEDFPELSMEFVDDSKCNIAKYFNSKKGDSNGVFYYYGALPMIEAGEDIPEGAEIFIPYEVDTDEE